MPARSTAVSILSLIHIYNVNNTEKAFNNPYCGDGAANNGRLSKVHDRVREYRFTQELTWAHEFDKHHIDVLLAHESFKHSYNYDFMMKEQMKVSGNTEMRDVYKRQFHNNVFV